MQALASHPSILEIILIPVSIFLIFFIIFLFILGNTEKETSIRLRIIIYTLIQFLLLPMLIIFLLINLALVLISLLCFKKAHYISLKSICLKRGSSQEIQGTKANVIVVKKRLHTEIENNSNVEIKKQQSIGEGQAKGITMPNIVTIKNETIDKSANNNCPNNNGSIVQLALRSYIPGIDDINKKTVNFVNNFPRTGKANKGKIMEFLQKALVSDDNTPSYINFIKTIKDKTKEKFSA
jgi:hypothetical protein